MCSWKHEPGVGVSLWALQPHLDPRGLGPAMQYGRCARPLSSPHNTFALNLNLELGDYWMAVYRYDLQLGPITGGCLVSVERALYSECIPSTGTGAGFGGMPSLVGPTSSYPWRFLLHFLAGLDIFRRGWVLCARVGHEECTLCPGLCTLNRRRDLISCSREPSLWTSWTIRSLSQRPCTTTN